MENNINTNIENKSKDNKLFFLGLFLIILLIGVAYLSYKFYFSNILFPQQKPILESNLSPEQIKNDYKIMFTETRNQQLFDATKRDLDKLTDPDQKLQMQVRLYSIYPYTVSVANHEVRSDRNVTTYNNFYDLYVNELLDKKDSTGEAMRVRVLEEVYKIYETSCFDYRDLNKSKWINRALYFDANNKYPDNKQLAALTFFNNFLNTETKKDKLLISVKIFVVARILDNFDKELSVTDKQNYVKNLGSLIKTYNDPGVSNTAFGIQKNTILPSMYYAYGLAVLSKYEQSITNVQVMKNYDDKLNIIKNSLSAADDPMGGYLALTRAMQLKYISDNNRSFSATTTKYVIDNFISSVEAIPDGNVKDFLKYFLQNSQNNMGSWDQVRQNLITVGKTNNDLKKLLIKYGIVF